MDVSLQLLEMLVLHVLSILVLKRGGATVVYQMQVSVFENAEIRKCGGKFAVDT